LLTISREFSAWKRPWDEDADAANKWILRLLKSRIARLWKKSLQYHGDSKGLGAGPRG
jgi:hypothetical protein